MISFGEEKFRFLRALIIWTWLSMIKKEKKDIYIHESGQNLRPYYLRIDIIGVIYDFLLC